MLHIVIYLIYLIYLICPFQFHDMHRHGGFFCHVFDPTEYMFNSVFSREVQRHFSVRPKKLGNENGCSPPMMR